MTVIEVVILCCVHIWGQAPGKAIAMKFCTGIDVHDVVTWAKFNL